MLLLRKLLNWEVKNNMKKLYVYGGISLIILMILFSVRYVFAQTVPMDMTSTDAPTSETEETVPAMPTGPSVSNISVTDITDTSARVDINSDELVQGYVEYGTSEQYGMSTPLTSEFSTSPSFILQNLSPETLYHYRVIVMDSSGNAAITADETFTTLATPTSEPSSPILVISNTETAEMSASTARIIWQTNKNADGQVQYGISTSYGALSPLGVIGTSHDISLSSLAPNTKYYYRAISKTSEGEIAYGTPQEFTTLAVQAVVTYPTISNVTISTTTSSAMISWTTSKPTTSNIQYGTTTSYGASIGKDLTLTTSHSRTLANLLSGTTYHFRIIATDSDGNAAYGKDRNFTTSASSQTTTVTAPTTPNNSDILANIARSESEAVTSYTGGGLPVISARPLPLNVVPLDGQVLFEWKKDAGAHNGIIHTLIVRKEGTDPVRSRIDGDIVYDGPDTIFTDTNVENGKEYHYGLYSYGSFGRFSASSHFKVVPRADREEVDVQATTIAEETTPTPALSLTRDLYRGLQGDDIKMLQTFLSTNGYYPEGLVTGYFGSLTKAAVVRFQLLNTISPVAGYVGPITKEVMGQIYR